MDGQAALDRSLQKLAASPRADPRDRGLATELFYGFLRLGHSSLFVLDSFLDNPAKLPAPLRRLLALSVFEILHLESVPPRASVSWAVDGAKALGFPRLSGLANAVMRNVARLAESGLGEAFFSRDSPDEAELLGRIHSVPAWLARLWLDSFGKDRARALLEAQTRPPALSVWVDPSRTGARRLVEELAAREDLLERAGNALAFPPGAELPRPEDPLLLRRQSLAAAQALEALDPGLWPSPVWDCCCGRGNKTRLLLERTKGAFLASDVHQGRLKTLARDPGISGVLVFRASAARPAPLKTPPRAILVDAPCSGLGVLSRRPDIKWKRTPADLEQLTSLQTCILDNAWAALAPGGVLAWVTCTLNQAENQDLLRFFLERTPNASQQTTFLTPDDSPLGEFFFASLLEKRA